MVLLILSFTELLLASHLCSVTVGYCVLATVLSPGTGWGWGVNFLGIFGISPPSFGSIPGFSPCN